MRTTTNRKPLAHPSGDASIADTKALAPFVLAALLTFSAVSWRWFQRATLVPRDRSFLEAIAGRSVATGAEVVAALALAEGVGRESSEASFVLLEAIYAAKMGPPTRSPRNAARGPPREPAARCSPAETNRTEKPMRSTTKSTNTNDTKNSTKAPTSST